MSEVPSRSSDKLLDYGRMYRLERRLETFKDWPFLEDCKCTPERMALAGFVHCPSESEPDVACCFFCLKELEGWEPDDDPWYEHAKRSPHCGFLNMKKDFDTLLATEFFKLEQQRLCIYIRKIGGQKIAQFREEVEQTRRNLQTLFSIAQYKDHSQPSPP
ncbi:baculoviral IAP repeat-containing protein 5b [Lepisosteus oculatus]|uniref:Baculoviral IAP repeat-containing protein 5-like n=1 Tax=Lepisosteus oculatus TaxID=7918 RepID=W5MK32_LEPOC|nr:PREDICTED: baculoviral IAP repeat-containing protein 5-like isoform X2 [Lepisosteus oculatus]XP_015199964.1 PREDICTED: baculoviral IAP repeat-containing protein 5-like isoform X2 [Lepisosteus oculatus]